MFLLLSANSLSQEPWELTQALYRWQVWYDSQSLQEVSLRYQEGEWSTGHLLSHLSMKKRHSVTIYWGCHQCFSYKHHLEGRDVGHPGGCIDSLDSQCFHLLHPCLIPPPNTSSPHLVLQASYPHFYVLPVCKYTKCIHCPQRPERVMDPL